MRTIIALSIVIFFSACDVFLPDVGHEGQPCSDGGACVDGSECVNGWCGGLSCVNSLECPVGYICQKGKCIVGNSTICNSNDDCLDEWVCVAIDADLSKCIPANEQCGSHLECVINYSCINYFCTIDPNAATCNGNEECGEGYSCAEMPGGGYKCVPGNGNIPGDQQVITDCGESCAEDGTCEGSYCFCCDSTCVTKFPSCSSDDDCYTGQVCLTSSLICKLEPLSCKKNGLLAIYCG